MTAPLLRPLRELGKVSKTVCGFTDRIDRSICGAPSTYLIEWKDGGSACRACGEHVAYLRANEDLSLVARIRDIR